MNKRREYGEGTIFTISNYFFVFLLGNLYFWLMNIPYIIVAFNMSLSGNIDINVILIMSMIPMGPAFTALLGVMGKLIREGDVNITKDFFKAYKINLFDSLFFWTLGLVILFILKIDILLISINSYLYFLKVLIECISYIIIALAFYVFPLISRFHLRKKDIIRISFEYLIKKIYIALLSFTVIYILFKIPNKEFQVLIILFSISIAAYVIMFLQNGVLREIEDRISNKHEAESGK